MSVDHTSKTTPASKRAFTLGLVAFMAVGSAALAGFAVYNYHRSNAYLKRVLVDMRRTGARTTAEGCVDHILAWRKTCPLSRVLCDNFAPRAMKICLQARDRTGYCRSLPPLRGTTRFGYRDCVARKMTRKTRNACAAAFRMLDQYCRGITAKRGSR